jgi:hypothetical protein
MEPFCKGRKASIGQSECFRRGNGHGLRNGVGSRQEIRIPPRKTDNEEDAGGREGEDRGPRRVVVSWHQKLSPRLSPSFTAIYHDRNPGPCSSEFASHSLTVS